MDNNNPSQPAFIPQPIEDSTPGITPGKARGKFSWLKLVAWCFGAGVLLVGAAVGIYTLALLPVDQNAYEARTVEIVSGMTPGEISQKLEEEGVIRHAWAFSIHARMNRIQHKLQAGTYQLRPDQSTQSIASMLAKGPDIVEIEITFLPGGTVSDARVSLVQAGYDEAEVDAALAAQYSHPLFAGRPATADLEGYLFGETHRFIEGAPLETVLTRYFDDFYAVIEEQQLVAKFRAQGLSLYEGITLASIIQRESGGDDKAQIAQVFLLRLERDMELGSDVTYQYIADKLGVPRDVNLDNPYNTRRYPGLPPGPIATPGVEALVATGAPASGEYLYFLSGDDDVTYFARTFAEHEDNIRKHCEQKCQII